jgi:hypothetical protein
LDVDKVEDEVVDSGEMAPVDDVPAAAEEPVVEKTKEIVKPVDIFADEKKADMTPVFVTVGVIGFAVALVVVGWFGNWASTAIYIVGLTLVPLLLWLGRKTNTVYTVFLGCVIAVLLTCVYCLWTVLAKYHFDVKASEAAGGGSAMAQPIDRGLQIVSCVAADAFADC